MNGQNVSIFIYYYCTTFCRNQRFPHSYIVIIYYIYTRKVNHNPAPAARGENIFVGKGTKCFVASTTPVETDGTCGVRRRSRGLVAHRGFTL